MGTSRTTARVAALALAASAVGAVGFAFVTTASAARSFSAPAAIQLQDAFVTPDEGAGVSFPSGEVTAPYPSTIEVSGAPFDVADLNVTLTNVSDEAPDQLDVLLVGPQGQQVVLVSDATDGTSGVLNSTFTLDDEASGPVPGSLTDGASYRPTDNPQDADSWPAPAPADTSSAGTSLSAFDGTDAHGTWSLYVEDDGAQDGGSIGSWSLDLTRQGATQPYPGQLPVSGLPDGITDVDVTVQGFTHPYPDDVDLMLVGPTGRRVLLMSDAGGGGDAGHEAADVDLSFDDEAGSAVPDDGPLESTSYRPANYGHDDVFPAPAPGAGSAGSSLGVFDGTDPNGIWRLFAVDQMTGGEGEITGGWRLVISTVDGPPEGATPSTPPVPTLSPTSAPGPTAPAGGSISRGPAARDTVGPKVMGTSPIPRALRVRIGASMRALVDERLDASTVTSTTVRLVDLRTSKPVRAEIRYVASRQLVTIDPDHRLAHGRTYAVTVGTQVRDVAGNRLDQSARPGLQPRTWRFTTR